MRKFFVFAIAVSLATPAVGQQLYTPDHQKMQTFHVSSKHTPEREAEALEDGRMAYLVAQAVRREVHFAKTH